jgi:hypothetical protein
MEERDNRTTKGSINVDNVGILVQVVQKTVGFNVTVMQIA